MPEGEQPEPMPVCVTTSEPERQILKQKTKSVKICDIIYTVFQNLTIILSVLVAVCTICRYLKELSGGATKKFEGLKKCDQLMHVMLTLLDLQFEVNKQNLKRMYKLNQFRLHRRYFFTSI